MRQLVFGQPVHIYGEHGVESLMLAYSLSGLARTVAASVSEAQLNDRLRANGPNYLVLQGSVRWIERFFALPRNSQIAGVIALPTSPATSAERARLMHRGVDACLPSAATPHEIASALGALGRLRFHCTPIRVEGAWRTEAHAGPIPAELASAPRFQPPWVLSEKHDGRSVLTTPDGLCPIELTTFESMLLATLVRTPGRTITGDDMHIALWPKEQARSRHIKLKSVHQLVSRLRRKARAMGYALPLESDYSGACVFKARLVIAKVVAERFLL
ncbi:hypothetical protein HBIAX_01893 [Achromobacter xylosoxidans]|uniref:Uncharacterized protein n=2 Tax=Alcaligenes xylosoxydans xylosoxydans TaxID=85698 RepID=A0A1R1JT18_ALCXX|nr:hypothetical protein BIZ92_26770 [Achromobacter xylosoxidans]BEG74844.1 hypothetical protein HBIAX_01893 [Achromobacter xylosoxidans]